MQVSSSTIAGRRTPTGPDNGLMQQVHQLQDTFTAVLAQFGREGFASASPSVRHSAEPGKEDASMEDDIASSWGQWFDRRGAIAYKDVTAGEAGGASSERNAPADLKREYGQILLDAYRNGGYATPRTFLQSLGKEQLTTIQTIHRLANPVEVSQLDDEGATNLLLPPAAQVDFDHDGLTQVGAARTIRFPDSSTPADVRDAWEQATADLSPKQKMLYEFQMKLPTLTANIRMDASGAVRTIHPGEPEWVNPMASPSFSYREAINQRLDYLDTFKNQMPLDQYSRDHSFWTTFAGLLEQKSST